MFSRSIFCVLITVAYGAQDVDILILGAGYSGLGAAINLHSKNVTNFLVLEAKDKIGGRVKSTMFAGERVPLGAGWLHRANENHQIYLLAKKYNLTLYKDSYDITQIMFRDGEDGKQYSESLIKEKGASLKTKISELDVLREKRLEEGGCDVSLRTALRWVGWQPNSRIEKAVEYFMFDFENAIDPASISASAYGYTGEGGKESVDYIVTDPRGFEYPIMQESKPVVNKIKLHTEVRKISRMSNKKYRVTVKDGTQYTAKHVLVTFSTGVLMSGNVEFEPKLPNWKLEGLSMAPMGHYCKIFVQFSEKFWDDNVYIMFATNLRGRYMHWQNFDVNGLFKGKSILMATLTGKICHESQLKSDDEIKKELYEVLKKVYTNATQPINFVRNDFSTDPHFLGSYSYFKPGITKSDRIALKHPINQSLWFTGEYTNGWDFGYVHGAYVTGQIASNAIVDCMNGKCPPSQPEKTPPKKCEEKKEKSSGHKNTSSFCMLLFLMVIFLCKHF